MFRLHSDWPQIIKELRTVHGIGLTEAIEAAFSHAGCRRWCNRRMNLFERCRKQAAHHLRVHGSEGLIVYENGLFRVR
ncbi:hypothetical protein ADU59_03650 [Pararhizobium polonicum]|uniref:Uncharacterized protein n=2 Tax=Pararhizobium polonicum TaxID=1612624 RepID=A0A1C7P6M7_9HYPH|nr:hypothetical protein ADU59_03650 [Pararhizobium polonicum]